MPSFYRILHLCIGAILRCKELMFSFPSTNEEFQEIADGLKALSTKEVFDGCVGFLDGLLLKIRTPSNKEAGNVKAFFSGMASISRQSVMQNVVSSVFALQPLEAAMI